MFHCHVCGNTEAHTEYVSEVFKISNQHILVEHIPALVCSRCGEEVFSREITERIRRMVHGEAKPVRAVAMEVFEFAC